jgi:putative FmdB family regulatory protein
MPLFEFECQKCREPFEELVRNTEAIKDVACPSCGSPKVRRKLSTFSAKVGGGRQSAALGSAASCAPGGT